MAKVKEMHFSKSIKLSNSTYDSGGLSYGITIEIEDGDDLAEVKKRGWATVDQQLEEQITDVAETLTVLSNTSKG